MKRLLAAPVAALVLLAPATTHAVTFDRVSVDDAGQQQEGSSLGGAVSDDGRYVSFMTQAPLSPNDSGYYTYDVYRFDRQTRQQRLVSRHQQFGFATGGRDPDMSADGRYVAFASTANNERVYVRDMNTNTLEQLDVLLATRSGEPQLPTSRSYEVVISGNGRYVAFQSEEYRLVADTPASNIPRVYVRDRVTQTTTLVSRDAGGAPIHGLRPSGVSEDGRYVTFDTQHAGVPGDTNNQRDVYVRDLVDGTTELVSAAAGGGASAGRASISERRGMSGDGRFVLFHSTSPHIVAGDTNNWDDLFLRDVRENTTRRVSTRADGTQAPHGAYDNGAAISRDGNVVAFASSDPLQAGDETGLNAYVKDLRDGTLRQFAGSDGVKANDSVASGGGLSGDGRFLSVYSRASNIGANALKCWTQEIDPNSPWWDPQFITVPAPCEDSYVVETGITPPPSNDAPQCPNATLTAKEGLTLSLHRACTDADGDTLSYRTVSDPAKGTLNASPNGDATYRANAGATGTDSFTYVANDGQADSNVATVTLEIEPNHPPVCPAGELAVRQGETIALTPACADADGDDLSYVLTEAPQKGTLTPTGPGAATYTASADESGFDTMAFAVADGRGGSVALDVRILVLEADGVVATLGAGDSLHSPGEVTADDPIAASVQVPNDGRVAIDETALGAAPDGYAFLGGQVLISAPPASADSPLRITFTIDGSTGADPASIAVMRNGTPVEPCAGAATSADPDPCALPASTVDGDVRVTVLTSHASRWNLAMRTQDLRSAFGSPIRGDAITLVKPGRVIPVKLTLTTAAGAVRSGSVRLSRPARIVCPPDATTIDTSTIADDGGADEGTAFTRDPDGAVWRYDLGTRGLETGACYRLTASLNGARLRSFTIRPKA